MKLAVSHLIFESNSDLESIQNYLLSIGISNLELVFAKSAIDNKYLLETKSAQSILYNTCIKDFLDDELYEVLNQISGTGKLHGVKTFVLGSPRQRKVFDKTRLISKFQQIDDLLKTKNQILCLEPNAKIYGGEYFHRIAEIVDFLSIGKFTNIRTVIDTHNLILENDNVLPIFEKYFDYIEHIHISEVNLSEFNSSRLHNDFSSLIKLLKYDKIITYEALNLKNPISSIRKFVDTYGN